MKELKYNNASITNINYHIVWCAKYKKKVLVNGVDTRLRELLNLFASGYGCAIGAIEIMPDHVRLFLSGNSIVPIHLIVKNLKAKSSRILRNEFPQLKSRLPSLWTRSYYCETIGCVNEDTIKKYIDNQKSK